MIKIWPNNGKRVGVEDREKRVGARLAICAPGTGLALAGSDHRKATHAMGIPTDPRSFFLAIATLVDLTDTCPNPQHDVTKTDCTGFISHESRDGTLSCSNKFPQL